MKVETYKCDLCGKEMDEPFLTVKFNQTRADINMPTIIAKQPVQDLCKECHNKLFTILYDWKQIKFEDDCEEAKISLENNATTLVSKPYRYLGF